MGYKQFFGLTLAPRNLGLVAMQDSIPCSSWRRCSSQIFVSLKPLWNKYIKVTKKNKYIKVNLKNKYIRVGLDQKIISKIIKMLVNFFFFFLFDY